MSETTYHEAVSTMARAVEVLADARMLLGKIPGPELLADALLLERIERRLENAAAQVELDRRLVSDVGDRQA